MAMAWTAIKAKVIMMFTTVHPLLKLFTGFFKPCNNGPIAKIPIDYCVPHITINKANDTSSFPISWAHLVYSLPLKENMKKSWKIKCYNLNNEEGIIYLFIDQMKSKNYSQEYRR